jgi:formyl-CoA transferase
VSGGNPPAGIYPCKGGGPNDYVYVFTSRTNPEHWRRLLGVLGRTDLIGDPRYDTPEAREPRQAEVDALVSEWTRKHDKHEAMRIIGAAGIPAGAVLDTKELIEDASLRRRGILQEMEHPVVDGYWMPTWPVRHDGAPVEVKPSPQLGEHSAAVLESWLGLNERDVEKLKREKII